MICLANSLYSCDTGVTLLIYLFIRGWQFILLQPWSVSGSYACKIKLAALLLFKINYENLVYLVPWFILIMIWSNFISYIFSLHEVAEGLYSLNLEVFIS
jgi:hypothetical protein